METAAELVLDEVAPPLVASEVLLWWKGLSLREIAAQFGRKLDWVTRDVRWATRAVNGLLGGSTMPVCQ